MSQGMTLEGKRALVTGGSGAIGSAICRRLAAAGADVIVHAHRNVRRAEEIAREIGGSTVSFDIRDGEAARGAVDRIGVEKPIQIVVHCAGFHDDAPMAGMTAGQWTDVIDVSLNGFFNATQPALLPMIRTRWGRIIALSSVSALMETGGRRITRPRRPGCMAPSNLWRWSMPVAV